MKTCNRCGETKPLSEFYLNRAKPNGMCKCCNKVKSRKYHKDRALVDQEFVEQRNARSRAWYRAHKGTPQFLEKQRVISDRYRKKLKREVIDEYGGKCECCGEKEIAFLTIDHIKNNGAQERKSIGRASTAFYTWLRASGFPKGDYRALCHNCNYGRYINGGVCPHKEIG